jgi:GNAT superfamily N-acetyltransferase
MAVMGAHMAELGSGPGASTSAGDGWWCWLSGQPLPDLNMAGIAGPSAATALGQAVDVIREASAPALLVLEDADAVASELAGAGYAVVGTMPLMLCPASVVPESEAGVEVAPIRDRRQLPAAATLMAAAFALPERSVRAILDPRCTDRHWPVQVWLATRDGAPVGAGMSVNVGSNVGVYTMSTPPEHERKGVGRSVLAAIHAYAQKAGADDLFLGATDAGLPLYERVGYETIARVGIAASGQSTQFPGH